jgi:predicted transcriptional regulator
MTRESVAAETFEDVAFLGGSPNRAELLGTLCSRGPTDRRELVDATTMSRVTVKRILDDLGERGWVANDGRGYWVTPVGEVVDEEFRRLVGVLDGVRRLADVVPWLPPDFDVDLRHLVDARVTVPTWSDSVAPVRRAAEACAGLDVLRVCASGVAPDVIRGIRDAAVVDGADTEVVMSEVAIGLIRSDPTMRGWFADLVEADGRVYEHPGHAYLLGVFDETAVIGLNDRGGVPRGLIESDSATVVEWVCSTADRCRSEADRLGPNAFEPSR